MSKPSKKFWENSGIIAVFTYCWTVLATYSTTPPFAYDIWWHLRMGLDLVNEGLSPWIDHYSFTFHGRDITTVPVLFEVTLAEFVTKFGERHGLQYFKLFYFSVLLTLLLVFFKRTKTNIFVVLLVLPLITYFILSRSLVRPELLSNWLIVICVLLFIRTQEDFSTKNLIKISLLLLFWVNYHNPIFGYVIIFSLFLQKGYEKLTKKITSFSWSFWFFWGLAILLLGFITPGGEHFLISSLAVFYQDFSKYIEEYQPSYSFLETDIFAHLFWSFSIYVSIFSIFKKQFGVAFLTLTLLYFSWSTIRTVAQAAIIILLILAHLMSQVSKFHLSQLKTSVRLLVLASYTGLVGLSHYLLASSALAAQEASRHYSVLLESRYPVSVSKYLEKHQPGGNIFADMRYGGYLIYKLAPNFKVFIDGRTNILYPIDHLKDFFAISGDPKKLKIEIEKGEIDYSLHRNEGKYLLAFPDVDNFTLNYADESFLLFSKNNEISFPITSRLLVFPACWSPEMAEALENERLLADRIGLGKELDIRLLMDFLHELNQSDSPEEFIQNAGSEQLKKDSIRRLSAFIALSQGNNAMASLYFRSLSKKNVYDLLEISNLLLELDQPEVAENLLYYVREEHHIDVGPVNVGQLFFYARLLHRVSARTDLTLFEKDYLKKLSSQVEALKLPEFDQKEFDLPIKLYGDACEALF